MRIKVGSGCGALAVGFLLFALMTVTGCSRQGKSGEEKRPSPVAQDAPVFQPLPQASPAPVRERVASQGDCAPQYKVGGKGTCINNQPCRGFGVKAENGGAVCTCYGKDGGCGEGQRCDTRRLACVPENEPLVGRGEVD